MANNLPNAALIEQIEAMINWAITAWIATSQPAPQPDIPRDNDKTQWYAANLGFFDPNYDGKTIATGKTIEHIGKDTIFWDVHLFIKQVKDIAATWRDELVRQNLSTCLKWTALSWYTSELIADQKRLLKMGHGIQE